MKTHGVRSRFSAPGATAASITVPDQDDSGVKEIDYVRWLSQLQSDLAASLGGIMLRGALPVAVGAAPGGTLRPLSSPGRIVGWSLHETKGTSPALVRLWNGREAANSPPLAYIAIGQGGVDNVWLGNSGISVTEAVLVEFVSGGGLSTDVEGVLYLGAVD